MGIKGLSRWLSATGCNQDLSKHSPLSNLKTDHLLVDMNGLLHQAYDAKDPSLNRTIERTVERVKQVMVKFKPHKSLTLVFDGFAPLAKLQTQKERRAGYAIVETEVGRGGGNSNSNNGLGRKSNSSDTGATDRVLCEGEITAGSPYLLMVEEAVVNFVTKTLMKKKNMNNNKKENDNEEGNDESEEETEEVSKKEFSLPSDLDFFLSPSTHIGEGEVKISQRLQQLSSSPNLSSPDDNIIIFGSDSDLVLVGLLAVKFHNIWVVHPSMNQGTSLGFLLLKFMDSKNVDCLMIDQLPSARIDFVFLMALAGGDFYTGIEEEAMKLWNRYKQKRSTPHGYHKRLIVFPSLMPEEEKKKDEPQHIIVASAPSTTSAAAASAASSNVLTYHQHQPRINAEFFQQVVGGGKNDHENNNHHNNHGGSKRYQPSKGKTPNQRMKTNLNNKKRGHDASAAANPGRGANVVGFALWTLEMLMMGRCEALGVAPAATITDQAVPLTSVQAFAKDHNGVTACRPRRSAISGLNACVGVERPPIFTFVAVAARASYLPIYVKRVLDENPQLKAKLLRPNSTTSNIVSITDEVLTLTKAHVAGNMNQLYSSSAEIQNELQTLLLNSPDVTHVGYSCTSSNSNNKNSSSSRTLVKKTSEELISAMTGIWSFDYDVGSSMRFRGLDRSGKEVIVNVVERKKKNAEKKGKNDVDDDDDYDEEEEEKEYDD